MSRTIEPQGSDIGREQEPVFVRARWVGSERRLSHRRVTSETGPALDFLSAWVYRVTYAHTVPIRRDQATSVRSLAVPYTVHGTRHPPDVGRHHAAVPGYSWQPPRQVRDLTMMVLLIALVMFTRLDGHACWIVPGAVTLVQGAGQLGYPTGTIINTGGGSCIVREDVNQVVRHLRGTEPNTWEYPN